MLDFIKTIAAWQPLRSPRETGGLSIIDVIDEAREILKTNRENPVLMLSKGWMESEKGNTMLTNEDNGSFVAWINFCNGMMLEVTYNPGNSPVFYVSVEKYSPKKLRKHVIKELEGWYVDRWNIDDKPPINCGNYVCKPKRKKK